MSCRPCVRLARQSGCLHSSESLPRSLPPVSSIMARPRWEQCVVSPVAAMARSTNPAIVFSLSPGSLATARCSALTGFDQLAVGLSVSFVRPFSSGCRAADRRSSQCCDSPRRNAIICGLVAKPLATFCFFRQTYGTALCGSPFCHALTFADCCGMCLVEACGILASAARSSRIYTKQLSRRPGCRIPPPPGPASLSCLLAACFVLGSSLGALVLATVGASRGTFCITPIGSSRCARHPVRPTALPFCPRP